MSNENIKIDIEWDTENKCWTGIMKFDDGFVEILASDIDELTEDVWSAHEDYLANRGESK